MTAPPDVASTPRREPAAARAAVATGLVAALAFVFCRRAVSHGFDVYWILPLLQAGTLDFPRHPLALHVAGALADLLAPFEPSLHERLKIVSGVCSGVAVGVFQHAAWLLTKDRRVAFAAAATFACLPSVAWFATVMELHGPFLPFAAVAFWICCRALSRPHPKPARVGIAAGAATAVAGGMHATSHLFVGFLCAWFLFDALRPPRAWRRLAVLLGCLLATHFAANWLMHRLLVHGNEVVLADAQLDALRIGYPSFDDLHRLVLGEWIVPFVPVSVIWIAALVRRPRPPLALALAASLPVYLGICQVMFVFPDIGYVFHEHGAYLLPLAFAATLLTVEALPRAVRFAPLLVALAFTIHGALHPEKEPPDREFGRRAAAWLRTHPERLVVGGLDEYEGLFDVIYTDPELSARLPDVVGTPQFAWFAQQNGARSAEDLALFFHPRFCGKVVAVTPAALERLRAESAMHRDLVERVLPALFTMTEAGDAATGFRAFRLEPR